MRISFTLNGSRRSVDAEPGESLQVLLQRMGVPSVRMSDDREGFSGSDTVLFDGSPALAGLMVAGQAEGHALETVEGLMERGRLSVLQEAMLDAGVVQSAYNSPAAALLMEELLRRSPRPAPEEVRDALSGLFSRGTGYLQFFLAAEIASARRRDPRHTQPVAPQFIEGLRVVGKSHRKVDGVKLVSGQKAYVEDRVEPGSCVLLMLRSPQAHAYIRSIDTAAAEGMPGVVAVITHRNCPDLSYTQAGQGFPEPSPYDYRMFDRKVRHVGDRVAAVVAEDEEAARAALAAIRVEYEPLPPILSIDDAMAARGPAVHGGPALMASGEDAVPGGGAEGSRAGGEDGADTPGVRHAADPREASVTYQFPIGADPARNLAASAGGGIGDVEEGFRQADAVVERTYTTSRVQCTPLEPHVVYTRMDGDRLVIHASTQVPWHLRRIVARVLGIRENRIRVIKERMGGGYGSKQDILLEEVAAWATWTTGRPVFFKYSREEEFTAATTRHPFRVTVKMGARRDGTLTAISYSAEADTGAYGNHALTVPMNSCSKSLPLLRCPNVSYRVRAWYTNQVPSGAYQGYGAPQGSFAVQMAAAELAAELGMDQLAFLERNRVREGDVLDILKGLGEGREGAAVRVRSCGLEPALRQGRQMMGWDSRPASADPNVRIGRGAVIIQQGSGLPGLDQACADVKMLSDGTFLVSSGGADLGTGLDTVLAKIAAETLCCDLDAVSVISGDTDVTPFDKGAYASSGTFFSGNAVLMACRDLAERIRGAAAGMLGEPAEGLRLVHPGAAAGKRGTVSYAEIAHHREGGEGKGELAGHGCFTTNDSAFPYAAHFVEASVDMRTGAIRVLRYHAVHDSGTPINPELALGQVYGAILKSIGHTLYEEMIFDAEGRCLTTGLGDYGVPMIQELPPDLQVRFVTTDDPFGPFGGKSVSEVSVNGAAPAIAIAVHDAAGVWLRDWPLTPEKVLRALGKVTG
jgi:putative selenate reductase molybdopterin-binding subunit